MFPSEESQRPLLRRLLEGIFHTGEAIADVPGSWLLTPLVMPFWALVAFLFPTSGRVAGIVALVSLGFAVESCQTSGQENEAIATEIEGPDSFLSGLEEGDRFRSDARLAPTDRRLIASHLGRRVVAYETRVFRVSEVDEDDGTRMHRRIVFRERGGPDVLELRARNRKLEVPLGGWRPSFDGTSAAKRQTFRDPRWHKVSQPGTFRRYEIFEQVLLANQKLYVHGFVTSTSPLRIGPLSPGLLTGDAWQKYASWRRSVHKNVLWSQSRHEVAAQFRDVAKEKYIGLVLLIIWGVVLYFTWLYCERWYWWEDEDQGVREGERVDGEYNLAIRLLSLMALCSAAPLLLEFPPTRWPVPWEWSLVLISSMWPVARMRRWRDSSNLIVPTGFAALVVIGHHLIARHVPWGHDAGTLLTILLCTNMLCLIAYEKLLLRVADRLRAWRHEVLSEVEKKWREAEQWPGRNVVRITLKSAARNRDEVAVEILRPNGSTEEAQYRVWALPPGVEAIAAGQVLQLEAARVEEVAAPEHGDGYRDARPAFVRRLRGRNPRLVREPAPRPSAWAALSGLLHPPLAFVAAGVVAHLAARFARLL